MKRAGRVGHIYVVQSGDTPRFKIGFAESVQWRIADLQVGNPDELRLVATGIGTMSDEYALQQLVGATRIRQEWFAASPELESVIAKMLAAGPDARIVDVFRMNHRQALGRGSKTVLSMSSETLAVVMDEDGPAAEAIRARFHRTMIWRFCRGLGRPSPDSIATLHHLSSGRVAANGWASARAAS